MAEKPRRRISVITKIFSVFFILTALDLSAIYIFLGTGQIDQMGKNGLLIAENAALRIKSSLYEIKQPASLTEKNLQKITSNIILDNGLKPEKCRLIESDGSDKNDNGKISSSALKAIRLYESEQQLFYANLKNTDFMAEIYIPHKSSAEKLTTVVACNISLDSLRESFVRLLRLSALILGITLFTQIFFAWFIWSVFLKRLRSLELSTRKITEGDFSGALTPGKHNDEIDQLTGTFNEMRLALSEKTEAVEKTLLNLEKSNFILEGDLLLGEEIQQSILPEKNTGKNINWEVSFRPLGKVSGDFYDIFEFSDATGFLQFDASGHGVPAALLTMMAKISFVTAIQKYREPREVMFAVNCELSSHLQKTGNFITAFYGIIYHDGRFVWCNAAHTQAVLTGKNEQSAVLLSPTCMSIGFSPTETNSFEQVTSKLNSGDRLILFTDGFTESLTHNGKQFGHEQVIIFAEQNKHTGLKQMHENLFNLWQQNVPVKSVEDDVTLLSIQVK